MLESRKPPANWPNGSKVTTAADGGREAVEVGRVVRNGTTWDMWSLRGDTYQHAGTAATQVEGIVKLPGGPGIPSQAPKAKEAMVPIPPGKGSKVGNKAPSKPVAANKAALPAKPVPAAPAKTPAAVALKAAGAPPQAAVAAPGKAMAAAAPEPAAARPLAATSQMIAAATPAKPVLPKPAAATGKARRA